MASDENIFSNLNPKTLGDVSATDINRTTRDVHIERKNIDALATTVLVNDATFRGDGGIIPGTGVIKSVDVTDNTRTILFTPDPGETWVLNSISAEVTNVGGTLTYTFFMSDGTTLVRWFYYQSSGASPIFQADADFPDMPMYYDENITLQFTVSGTYDSVAMNGCFFRVR